MGRAGVKLATLGLKGRAGILVEIDVAVWMRVGIWGAVSRRLGRERFQVQHRA